MGPLQGIKVIELAGIGPGPFCGMLLSDMGAEVIRIERKGARGGSKYDVLSRGRKSVAVDLKKPEGVEMILKLIEGADILQEGYRPGVTERLGLGPDVCLKRNPKLVYGRMTGWGQYGPMAQAAGHDINYLSLTGALHSIGTAEKPVAPLNLAGDFGGGALYLAMGLLAAVLSAQRTGKGQVVDVAMTDGAASLMSMMYGMTASGMWDAENRSANMLDGGAHFYDTYETLDGKWISIGSIEPQFYALLRTKAGLDDAGFDDQMNRVKWPDLKAKVAEAFKTKTRAEWDEIMSGSDVCYGPVLSMNEAPSHPHNIARETFVEVDGVVQPNVAPRFSETKSAIQGPPCDEIGRDTESVLAACGFSEEEISVLKSEQAI
ncbi:MAG: alpha-methylacyl-CoA racemase [Gammaproteobacteria bacterium]|jgi:alpha-methylacyl-CoA racemase